MRVFMLHFVLRRIKAFLFPTSRLLPLLSGSVPWNVGLCPFQHHLLSAPFQPVVKPVKWSWWWGAWWRYEKGTIDTGDRPPGSCPTAGAARRGGPSGVPPPELSPVSPTQSQSRPRTGSPTGIRRRCKSPAASSLNTWCHHWGSRTGESTVMSLRGLLQLFHTWGWTPSPPQ